MAFVDFKNDWHGVVGLAAGGVTNSAHERGLRADGHAHFVSGFEEAGAKSELIAARTPKDFNLGFGRIHDLLHADASPVTYQPSMKASLPASASKITIAAAIEPARSVTQHGLKPKGFTPS